MGAKMKVLVFGGIVLFLLVGFQLDALATTSVHLTLTADNPINKIEEFFKMVLEGAVRITDWVAILMFFKAGLIMFQGEREKAKQLLLCIFYGCIIIRYAPRVLEIFRS